MTDKPLTDADVPALCDAVESLAKENAELREGGVS